ncbi:hypothetical protein HELRODRAFT_178635 [Helobdella robusta]|uniref:Uncharacterized protein n=1 Tax=Helobdella robusta TaxID=6412 RepID=T1FDH2_HELRO|nr:hypothetical protein HELRODRAFT_178635 [Helobdella robusta]ESN96835.1 hypothetical protein HELRODRAFT_178635 [Helobdella robusta]
MSVFYSHGPVSKFRTRQVLRVHPGSRSPANATVHPSEVALLNEFCKQIGLRSALNFVSDGKVVREVGRGFQRKGPEKAKADLAKECLTRVRKKREQEDDRKQARLDSINISDKYLGNNLDSDFYINV